MDAHASLGQRERDPTRADAELERRTIARGSARRSTVGPSTSAASIGPSSS